MTVNWFSEVVHLSGGFMAHLASDSAKYVCAFAGALGLSLALTPVCRSLARKLGMIDRPDARRINRTPIPRGGGLAVFISFHVVLCLTVLALGQPISQRFSSQWQWSYLLASSLLVAVGFIDDKWGMRAIVKLVGQIAVATILFVSGVRVGGVFFAFPPWLDYLATVFWIVGAVNAFNLIDGMDGLASGLALIAALGLAGAILFTGSSIDTIPYLVLAGACLGFLRYNFHPASVFLGDTGSMFLGLCVATLPLMTGSRKELVASLGVPLLAMGIPIFDTMLAIWRRTVRALLPQAASDGRSKTRVMQPDKDHIHHRLLRDTMSQRSAAIMLYCGSLALVSIGLAGTLLRNRAPGLFLLAFIAAIIVVVRHLERVELWDTGRLLSHKRVAVRQGLLVPLYILVDVCSLCAAWICSRWLLGMSVTRVAILSELPLFVVPSFVFLALAKTYARVWSHAQARDFATLALALFAGALTSIGLSKLLGAGEARQAHLALLAGCLAILPVEGVRVWRDSVRGLVQLLERRILLEQKDARRLLAYGGGVRFKSLLSEREAHAGYNDSIIVGILDDDIQLKGRLVGGVSVLGTFDDFEAFAASCRADTLIITCLLAPARQAEAVARARAAGLRISVWVTEVRELGAPQAEEVRG
jgi:UDP-N-acetylmuramyl pentapeptide phosphotransferase/UDP-N-acetylglucosamine-1-phosphate transferase